jgi:phosphatidylglycerophosphate synthase
VADALTGLRIALLPILWWQALIGNGSLVGLGLLAAGATDVFDGRIARRLGQESRRGAQLDAVADILLLASAAGWIELLHPEIVRDNRVLVTIPFAVYLVSLTVGLIKFRRLVNTHLYLPKVAGVLLYGFTVVTLVEGGYNRLLLVLAAVAFTLSSAEMLAAELLFSDPAMSGRSVLLRARRADITTSHASDNPRKPRSQTPMPTEPGSSSKPTSNMPAAATPKANESRP